MALPAPIPTVAWRSSSRSPEQTRVLAAVLARIAATNSHPVATFDLDSTLFDNRPRQLAILTEFAKAHGLRGAGKLRVEEIDGWRLTDALPRLEGFKKQATELLAQFKPFWRERFFTSEFCLHDDPLPGAADYVVAAERAGAAIVYLTGRHEAMRTGTLESLATGRFPAGTLLAKPTFEMTDTQWKEVAIPQIRKLGTVVACFDNETTHVNRLRAAFPGAMVVWLRTDHSPEAESLPDDVSGIDGFLR